MNDNNTQSHCCTVLTHPMAGLTAEVRPVARGGAVSRRPTSHSLSSRPSKRSSPTMRATLTWSPLPSEGDIRISTVALFMGTDFEDVSLITRLTTKGYRINDVKVLDLQEERGCALVSMWQDAKPEIKKIKKGTSSHRPKVSGRYAPALGGAIQVRYFGSIRLRQRKTIH